MWISSWSHNRQPSLSSERRRAHGSRRQRLAYRPTGRRGSPRVSEPSAPAREEGASLALSPLGPARSESLLPRAPFEGSEENSGG